ncbi:MAG: hypothetical protein ACI4F4_08285 [Lachnospiraceae bacterium]
MKQMLLEELKYKWREIKASDVDEGLCQRVLDAVHKILYLAELARKEGLLILDVEAEKLDLTNANDKYLSYLTNAVVSGFETELIRTMGLYRLVALDLPSYEGLINFIYLEGLLMIQAGENYWVMEHYLQSLLPEMILKKYEENMVK